MDAFRTGFVYVEDCYAGTLSETEDGYRFAYDADYLSSENPRAVSLTLLSLEARYCLAICCTVTRIVSPAVAKRIHRCFSLCQTEN